MFHPYISIWMQRDMGERESMEMIYERIDVWEVFDLYTLSHTVMSEQRLCLYCLTVLFIV